MLLFNYAGYLFCAVIKEGFLEEIKIVGKENKKYKNFEELKNLLMGMINFKKFSKKQKNVYLELMKVPKGKVTTYKYLGKKTGVYPRAVARYMAINRLPIVIPCHRVVMSDLTLGGYSLGIKIKKSILEYEGVKFLKNRVLKEYVIF